MSDSSDARVGVYLDFDNIVISRYDQVNGRGSYMRDRPRNPREDPSGEFRKRLEAATIDVGAVIDFASSYGTLVFSRAYADWSVPVNGDYRAQLVSRAVDLVQLFPAAAYGKNGADIRLAVDAIEDMFRLPDLTHLVLVAGDSDYIALAQRAKRLGRYVVAIGVAGSTSRMLAAACDELVTYDDLPGIVTPRGSTTRTGTAKPTHDEARTEPAPDAPEDEATPAERGVDPQDEATSLLDRALRIRHEKEDADWLHSSAVKQQMKRMDPSFSERSLGFRSFSDFLKSRPDIVELDDSTTAQLVRHLADAR
ncbi:NYN domain-containing protein [Pseudoclavibacter chungangensis]|uniref:NYN domain-containing protein n=1 Tax=Pseudoclavibacter chungangensis TaxID=587635 RepID=A0A7J5C124_9MICO|nr:NYN domain-containing protein [Pseudoclavibacter chungangensis]KAB1662326.1 NYN domain-containing protein [Pseudoclavibacter chungangensis]NYJ65535.1 hypothetical protein [Pseudoclavibacter chungangensis]